MQGSAGLIGDSLLFSFSVMQPHGKFVPLSLRRVHGDEPQTTANFENTMIRLIGECVKRIVQYMIPLFVLSCLSTKNMEKWKNGKMKNEK